MASVQLTNSQPKVEIKNPNTWIRLFLMFLWAEHTVNLTQTWFILQQRMQSDKHLFEFRKQREGCVVFVHASWRWFTINIRGVCLVEKIDAVLLDFSRYYALCCMYQKYTAAIIAELYGIFIKHQQKYIFLNHNDDWDLAIQATQSSMLEIQTILKLKSVLKCYFIWQFPET